MPFGAVYVADSTNNAIRAIPLSDATAAAVFATVTVAGDTTANPPAGGLRDGPPLTAQFSNPTGVYYFERAGGKALGVADTYNNAVRGVLLTGFGLNASSVVTIAGGGRGYSNGVGTDAMFFYPANLGVSSCGDFLVADDKNNAIRAVCPQA